MADFTDRTVLVTGAATGIGLGISKAFLAAGARVALGDVNDRSLAKAAERVGRSSRVFTHAVDVRDLDSVDKLFRAAESALGPVDVVVANAGIYPNCPVVEMSVEEWDRVMETNVRGVFLTCQAAARNMGAHWSFPTLTRTFGHIYDADWRWLQRFRGDSPSKVPGGGFATFAALRPAWDTLEVEQRVYLEGLTDADLGRLLSYTNSQGIQGQAALGPLLQHVVNHATHHRSEIATMITLISGSPPDTGIATYRATVVKG